MSEPDRPPLNPIIFELIDRTLHKIDTDHWQSLAAMQVGPQFGVPETLRAPKSPALLLNALQVYAGALFKAEADNYEELRKDGTYPAWLSRLAHRIVIRVLSVVGDIDRANVPASLKYHGLPDSAIRDNLEQLLRGLENHYAWRDSGPQIHTALPAFEQPSKSKSLADPKLTERETLRDSYRAAFPDVKIADIYWAAEQTYREWKRWIKGEAKNGSKPDRAFRHVLTSGKKPEEIRRQPRPTKYNV
jgi:hypothetical protein